MSAAIAREGRVARCSRSRSVAVAAGIALLAAAWLLGGWTGEAHAAPPTWERAWGEDVVAGNAETGFETCTVAADCQSGVSTGGLGGELNAPRGIASDADGNTYVAEPLNHRVQKFDSDGNFLRAWGKDVVAGNAETGFETCTVAADCKAGVSGSFGGELNNPYEVAVDATGGVYVADRDNDRIQRFDSDGNFQRTWGKNVSINSGDPNFEICTIQLDCKAGDVGTQGGDLNSPRSVAADPEGNVYVVDEGNVRVQKYNSSGVFQRAWGKDVVTGGGTGAEICTVQADCKAGVTGSLGGELASPRVVATDGDAAYVSNANTRRIDKFDSSGNFERAWGKDVVTGGGTGFEICTVAADCKSGSVGGLGGELNDVIGLVVDPAGDVHAADTDGDRVQQFDSSGNFERAWGKDVVTGGDTGFEICTVAADCKTGVNGSLGGELSGPAGVAADDADHIYVADRDNHRIQRLSLDATPPETAIDSGPDDPTNDSTPTFTFSADDPEAAFECRFDADPFGACSGPGDAHTPGSALSEGGYTFEVRATDEVGNIDPSPASQTFTVDTTPPQTTIDTGSDDPTNDDTPTFTFSSNDAGASFECQVDGGGFTACTSQHTTAALSDGEHTFRVRATDQADNTDATPAEQTFTVDTAEPNTTIDNGPDDPTNDDTPELTFSSNEAGASFECQVDGGGFSSCTSPHTTASLSDGEHTFDVRATDQADNTDSSPASQTFTVDTAEPNTTIDSGPDDPTNDDPPEFTFSSNEAGSSFECQVDGGGFNPCASPHTTAALGEGEHTFDVRATDGADNTDASPASQTFAVDTTNPDTTIDSGPSGSTTDATPEFTFSSGEAGVSFECQVDGAGFSPCASPHTTASLAQGAHTFHVRAVDEAGNADPDPASRSFTVVTTTAPPPPPNPSPDTTPPDCELTAESGQRAGGATMLEASCDEDTTATATGKVVAKGGSKARSAVALQAKAKKSFKLAPATADVPGGETATLSMKPKGAKAKRGLKKLVKGGAKAKASITATFADRAGNSAEASLVVKLK